MKKIAFLAFALSIIAVVNAQQKEGKVIYQRSTQLQMRLADHTGSETETMRTRTDKFELNFANGQMILTTIDDEMPDDNPGGGGMMIRTIGAGADDATFCDFSKARKVELREFFDKKFFDNRQYSSWQLETGR